MNSILFLHGGSLNKEMWIPQMQTLKSEFDIHALDLPGHGQYLGTPFSLESAVDMIEKYITQNIEGNVIVVGLSLGGYMAIAYAHKHPDKVSGLILSGCCVQYFGFMGFLAKASLILSKLMGKKFFVGLQRKALTKITSNSIAERICNSGISHKGGIESLSEIIGKDFVHMLNEYKGPILIVNGENDTFNSKYEYLYATVDNNISISTLRNCGHICSLEKPDVFTDLVKGFASKIHAK